jgi:CheY-like chemotaxis protein
LVEDSLVVIRALENALRAPGYEVVSVTTASDALKAASAQPPDLMILDLTLASTFDGFRDGFAVLYWLRHTLRDALFPVIIHTADLSSLVDQRAREAGVFAVIRKGDSATNILDVVRQAFETSQQRGLLAGEGAEKKQ